MNGLHGNEFEIRTFLKYFVKEVGNLHLSKLNINFEVSSLIKSSNFKILFFLNKGSEFDDHCILLMTRIALFCNFLNGS